MMINVELVFERITCDLVKTFGKLKISGYGINMSINWTFSLIFYFGLTWLNSLERNSWNSLWLNDIFLVIILHLTLWKLTCVFKCCTYLTSVFCILKLICVFWPKVHLFLLFLIFLNFTLFIMITVKDTNIEALKAKKSAVLKGYMKDQYINIFVP